MKLYIILYVMVLLVLSGVVYGVTCTNTPVEDCTVDGDLTLSGGKTFYLNDTNGNGAIIINANNLILNCNGSTLQGNGTVDSRGIQFATKQDVTIKNCIFDNYSKGIYADSIWNTTIFNNTFNEMNNTGIHIRYGAAPNIAQNITISYNTINMFDRKADSLYNGIYIQGTISAQVKTMNIYNNYIWGSYHQIYLTRTNSSIIRNNKLNNCTRTSLWNDRGKDYTISYNNITNTTWNAIDVNSNNNSIYNNIISNTHHNSIDFGASYVSKGNRIYNNTISNVYCTAIYIADDNESLVYNNNINGVSSLGCGGITNGIHIHANSSRGHSGRYFNNTINNISGTGNKKSCFFVEGYNTTIESNTLSNCGNSNYNVQKDDMTDIYSPIFFVNNIHLNGKTTFYTNVNNGRREEINVSINETSTTFYQINLSHKGKMILSYTGRKDLRILNDTIIINNMPTLYNQIFNGSSTSPIENINTHTEQIPPNNLTKVFSYTTNTQPTFISIATTITDMNYTYNSSTNILKVGCEGTGNISIDLSEVQQQTGRYDIYEDDTFIGMSNNIHYNITSCSEWTFSPHNNSGSMTFTPTSLSDYISISLPIWAYVTKAEIDLAWGGNITIFNLTQNPYRNVSWYPPTHGTYINLSNNSIGSTGEVQTANYCSITSACGDGGGFCGDSPVWFTPVVGRSQVYFAANGIDYGFDCTQIAESDYISDCSGTMDNYVIGIQAVTQYYNKTFCVKDILENELYKVIFYNGSLSGTDYSINFTNYSKSVDNQPPTNITIKTDNEITYQNLTQFTGSVADIDLNISSLQKCVNNFEVNNGTHVVCLINISSATAGIINYSNLEINYNDFFLDNCTNGSFKVLRITGKDEETDIDVNLSLNIYMSSASIHITDVNISYRLRGNTTYEFCTDINNSDLTINAIMEYGGDLYTYKKYYLNDYVIDTAVTSDIYLYHLNNSKASETTFTVFDSTTGDKVSGAFIKILRYYPEENVFRTVEIAKTDEIGESLGKMVLADVFYKFIIEKPAGTVKLSTDILRILSLTRSFGISFATDVLDTWDKIQGVSKSVTCTQSTQTCRITWSDSSNIVQDATLSVYRNNGFRQTLLYTQTTSSAAGTISYTITEPTAGNTYIAKGYIESNTGTSGYGAGIDSLIFSDNPFFTDHAHRIASLFPLFLLGVALISAFIDFGTIGVVLGSLATLVVGAIIKVLPITSFYLVSFILLGGILIYKLSR